MPAVLATFGLARFEDGCLNIQMEPAVNIGGWDIRFQASHRFGSSSGFIQAYTSSGYSGTSGITITDSGLGWVQIPIPSQSTSGMAFGNYAFSLTRTTSGYVTDMSKGYMTIDPSMNL